MARDATINVSLTPGQLRQVRQQVDSGHYQSASEVVRDGLRMLFQRPYNHKRPSQKLARLEQAYRATAKADRELADDWNHLSEAWPEK